MKSTLLLIACAAFTCAYSPNTFAGYRGSVSFTQKEMALHAQGLKTIMEAASNCLQNDLRKHNEFIRQFGVSAFFGDNSSFAKKTVRSSDGGMITVDTTVEDKRNILRGFRVQENLVKDLVPASCPRGLRDCPLKMEPTSCIGLTMKCLGRGFRAAGQGEFWSRIEDFTEANDEQGDALQAALQKLGWKIFYWNPDVSRAREWDLREQYDYPGDPKHIWGRHQETWNMVRTRQMYFWNHVDDFRSLVNFGTSTPALIKRVPFFVGIAHLGYHVFPGSYGRIIEGHSTRQVVDPNSLQSSAFNPLVRGGGPRGGPYKSGIVAIPPGY